MQWRGFTIIEVIITITIMGILMTLVVIGISSSQVQARDDERKADIETIYAALDNYYSTGTDDSTTYNTYPPVSSAAQPDTLGLTDSSEAVREYLRDVNFSSFIAPGESSVEDTFIAATNSAQGTTTVTPLPTVGQYVYQPLTVNNQLCDLSDYDMDDVEDICRKYNLYYRTESNNTVMKVMSKSR